MKNRKIPVFLSPKMVCRIGLWYVIDSACKGCKKSNYSASPVPPWLSEARTTGFNAASRREWVMLRGWALTKSWVYMLQCWQGAWTCLADVVHCGGGCAWKTMFKRSCFTNLKYLHDMKLLQFLLVADSRG